MSILEQKENFFQAVESLKKYRRAELIDKDGRDLLDKLYVDLLPDNYILKKCMSDNTTYLVGRKGTGKSTLFLRIESELRKKENYLPCYLDVKTIYESSQAELSHYEYLEGYLSKDQLIKYSIERNFIQSVLQRVIDEIDLECKSFFERFKNNFVETKKNEILVKLQKIKNTINDNDHLEKIELPIIQKRMVQVNEEKSEIIKTEVGIKGSQSSGEVNLGMGGEKEVRKFNENNFASILLQIFNIKDFIQEVKELLKEIKVRHIVVLLDDFSEIEDDAIKSFVDVVLAPLNNWSDEFIKFKIAAYPGRVYYGKIDPGKVDLINLDFFNLYSEFDRSKMEDGAIDFTKRLLEQRINFFTKKSVDYFFEYSKTNEEDLYATLFKVSMNVPRIMGYILSYCYQSRIIYGKKILISDIENASLRYYKDKVEPYFHKTTFSLYTLDEKMNILQQKELLLSFVNKLIEIRNKIKSGELSGDSYLKEEPYSSHFNIENETEKKLTTLELNYFLSKYGEMSDRDGKSISVYCLNFGLAQDNNLSWGKPKGSQFRKYFIQRPFAFNGLVDTFLSKVQKIHCKSCGENFTQEHIPFLEFSGYKCNKCGGQVVCENFSEEIKNKIINIDEANFLSSQDIEIIMALTTADVPLLAKEIAEEVDMSSQSIGRKCKKLDEVKHIVKRTTNISPFRYELTEKGKNIYKVK